MPYNFVPCNRNQAYLLPPSLRDWLPETHLAWFIVDAVEQMDLSGLYAPYRADGWGATAFDPKMMTTLLLYAYCLGARSSREIERLCECDIAFRVIAANARPDHSERGAVALPTIARFRQAHEKPLARLFAEILRLCAEAGLVRLGVVALDGTKMRADAALSSNRTAEGLETEVQTMLAEAQAADAREDAQHGRDRRGDELPEGLQDRRSRLARLKECRGRLAREAAGQVAEQARKIEQRQAEEAATGKKKRGRKPKAPEAAVNEEAKANLTDPENRIMKTAKGRVQGYNAQAVTTVEQIIVAADVTQEANDVKQPEGRSSAPAVAMMAQAQENTAAAGMSEKEGRSSAPEIGAGLMDAGYWSEANATALSGPDMPEALIATTNRGAQ